MANASITDAEYKRLMRKPIRCRGCSKVIGRERIHVAVTDGQHPVMLCSSCANGTETRALHRNFYPDCPHDWHDVFDHAGLVLDRVMAHLIIDGRFELSSASK